MKRNQNHVVIWALTCFSVLVGMMSVASAQPQEQGPPPEGQRPPQPEGEDHFRPWGHRFENRRFGGPGGPGGPQDGRMPGPELTDEQIDEGIAVLRLVHPVFGEEVAKAREEHPERVRALIAPHWWRIERLVRMKSSDPEAFQLFADDARLWRESRELGEQLQSDAVRKDPQRIEELQDELRAKVIEHFAVRQKMQANEVERLEKRLNDLRRRVEDRAKRREELIVQRYHELVGEDDQAKW